MKGKVKIEVNKENGHFYYTGYLTDLDKEHYLIDTIKDEKLIFKKSQVVQIEMIGDDNESSGNK